MFYILLQKGYNFKLSLSDIPLWTSFLPCAFSTNEKHLKYLLSESWFSKSCLFYVVETQILNVNPTRKCQFFVVNLGGLTCFFKAQTCARTHTHKHTRHSPDLLSCFCFILSVLIVFGYSS